MNKYIFRKLTAVLTAAELLLPALPAAAAETVYLADIGFDEEITNDISEHAAVMGSETARVAEDGSGNKSYTVECGYIDNAITVYFPEYKADKKYAVQFDMRAEGAPFSGKITLNNALGISAELLIIDEKGILRTNKNQRLGSVKSSRMQTVTIMLDTELKLCTAMVNGKYGAYRQSMEVSLENASELVISTNASGADSRIYIDNVRVYNGDEYINKSYAHTYNPVEAEYIPIDESAAADKVYYKNALDSSSSLSMSKNLKGNRMSFETEAENGFIRMIKDNSSDMYFDISNLGKTSKRVVACADFRFKKSMPEIMFYFRDNVTGGTQTNFAPVSLKGNTVTAQGTSVQLRKNVWYNVSIVLDISSHKYKVFLNDDLIAENLAFNSSFGEISVWRMYVNGGTQFGAVDIDNLALYAGTEPRDISNAGTNAKSRFNANDALSFLRGKRAISLYGNTSFSGGVKKVLEDKTEIRSDDVLISPAVFGEFFAKAPQINGGTVTIGNISMTVGSDTMRVGGAERKIPNPPELIGEKVYIPAIAYGEAQTEQNFVNDEHGMLVIGNGIKENDTRMKEANIYLFFERKSGEELKEQFLKNTDNGSAHPRLLATAEDFSRLREEVKTDPVKAGWYESVLNTADTILKQEPSEYKISNGRLLDVANATLSRMKYLGFAYQISGNEAYAKRGVEELEAVCAFPDWHPDHYLDTGTLAAGVAVGFDWLYTYMTEEQREKIAASAKKLALDTAKDGYYGTAAYNDFWCKTETNWGIICNGGIADLALATGEYNTDEAMDVLSNALISMEYPWYRLAPDGAWYDGTGYWSYLLTHLSLFMGCYETSMGEVFGKDYMGLDRYGYFQTYFMGPDGLSNNFNDADEENVQCGGQFYLAKIYGDSSLMLYRLDQMKKYNTAPDVFDILWYDSSLTGRDEIELDKDAYYRETEFVAMREKWGAEDAAWLSFHGGMSNAAHDHVDKGTFVYNIGGVRWAVETGREMLSYSVENPAAAAGYDGRYYYRRKGEGHNILVVNPDKNLEMSINGFAKVGRPVTGENGSYAVMDLSEAYADKALDYKRGWRLSDSRRTLTVRDEISLRAESELHWFMHTRGQIRIVDQSTAIIYQDGKQLLMQFKTNAEAAELKGMDAVGFPQSPQFTQTENKEFTKIDYELKGSGDVTVTVKLSLLGETGSKSGVDETPIDKWNVNTIPAGEAYSYCGKRLDGIFADGRLLTKFDPERFSYTYSKNQSGEMPEITASASGCEPTIEYYKRYDDTDVALIALTDENGMSTTYTVLLNEYDESSIDVYNAYSLKAVKASSEQVEGTEQNVKENSCDGDYSTRWSANGKGEWCVYDMGEVKSIDAFAAAFWMGGQRRFSFDIAVSEDGVSYKNVVSATTKGNSEDAEVYLPNGSVRGRYIKLTGHGSNANDWNNVIEFMALAKK